MAKAAATSAAPTKAPKTSNPSTSIHPPYFQMISEAILALNDRSGSSQPAIVKFIEEKYKDLLIPNFKKILSVQLKKFVKSDRLVKVKNSYKLSSTEKLKLSIQETLIAQGRVTATVKEKKLEKDLRKTKRLSQLKTPEVLKMEKKAKMRRLSEVKTPTGFKNDKKSVPMERKNLTAGGSNSRSQQKVKI